MLLNFDATFLAPHVATPVKLAMAALYNRPPAGIEPAPAAHQFAPVGAVRRSIARPAARAKRPGALVGFAEIGGGADVDEIGVGRLTDACRPRDQLPSGTAAALLDLDGGVEPIAQEVANLAEGRHRSPASLELARTGNAVAFALNSNVVFDCLTACVVIMQIH